MGSVSEETFYDKLSRRLRDNPIIAVVLMTIAGIVGVASFTGAIDDIWQFADSRVFGRSKELRTEYCELLRPLVVELDRTKAAFDRWNKKDLSLESETIRDANLRARALLREKGHLVPDSLREDQSKLVLHYDQWLEEFDRVRVRKTTNPDAEFVFVFSFPRESEQLFRQRMTKVEARLGSEARCG